MTPVRKASPAEKATAARLRDLKHLAELAMTRPPSGGEVEITDMVKGEPKVRVAGKQQDGQAMKGLAWEMVEVYDWTKQELAKRGYTGNADPAPKKTTVIVRPKATGAKS